MKNPKIAQAESIQSIEEAINKTGFVLEHLVASKLEEQQWNVIHNRYYLDDVTQMQREMDILAYKTYTVQGDTRVVTALIISCKKNAEYDWVFMTRKAPGMSPNINMLPLKFNSNVDSFNFQLDHKNWSKESFIKKHDSTSLIDKLYNYDRTVFAYQEIRKFNNAPSNDSNIYASIISLIKAQSYEISSLEERWKNTDRYVYNINLLSIADLEFHELHYQGSNVSESKISRINYLNRFLINGVEHHAKIDFIKYEELDKAIKDYNDLTLWNNNYFLSEEDNFYSEVLTDNEKKTFVIEKYKEPFLSRLRMYCDYNPLSDTDITYIYLNLKNKTLQIDVTDNEMLAKDLNSDEYLKKMTKQWLKSHFKYEGKFEFVAVDNLPF